MEFLDHQVTEDSFVPCNDRLDYFEHKQDMLSQTFDEYFAKYPLCYKRAIQFANRTDSQLVAMMMGNLRQQKCKDLIFKLLNQHIDSWWD